MKIAVVGNVSLEGIAEKLANLGYETYTGYGFDTWMQDLVNPNSDLYSFAPKIVFLLLDGKSLFESFSGNEDPLEGIKGLVETVLFALKAHPDFAFVVSSLDIPLSGIKALCDRRKEIECSAYWRNKFSEAGVPVLDLFEMVAQTGRDKFYNNKGWYLGGLRFSLKGEKKIASSMDLVSKAIVGKRKKVLALDLDNTLWGGVIGEDGLEGIDLSQHGQGARFYDFQKRLKEIKDLGVLLAVVSKNNPEDALNAIRQHSAMVLKEEDFVSMKINWAPKPQNIAELARELNLSLDSIVFIDDNPVERESVRASLPEVEVPYFPDDTTELEAFARGIAETYFLFPRLTAEDMNKTEQYKVEAEREKLKNTYSNLDDYLSSLEMVLDLKSVRAEDVPRVAQLTQKTNQFNLTTRRYTEAEIQEMLNSSSTRLYLGNLKDRFGDYGKTVLAIIRLLSGKAVVDTFLMSCRVMGRGVEEAALDRIEEELKTIGVTEMEGHFIPTQKNSPVIDFWERMGYTRMNSSPGHAVFLKLLDDDSTRKSFVRVLP